MNEPQDAVTQREWLRRDLDLYRELLVKRQDLLAPLGDLTDKPRQNLYAVVADLYWLAIHHGLAAAELIEEELRAPLGVVERALFETMVSLRYLITRRDPVFEAVVYRAYSFMKEMKFFPTNEAVVAERQKLLRVMPQDAVEEAKKRVKKRQNWSGQNMRVMVERIELTGYDLYGWLSEQAHSRVVGHHVRVERTDGDKGLLRFGRAMDSEEKENAANFTRRMLAHAFMDYWSTFAGGPVNLPTNDPFKWVIDTGGYEG